MRIKIQVMFFIATAILLLGACRKSTPNQNANSNAGTSAQDTLDGGAAPAGEKVNLRGSIANLSIEMNLVREGERLTGSYFYPRVGKNIDLKGEIDRTATSLCASPMKRGKKPASSKANGNRMQPVWRTLKANGLVLMVRKRLTFSYRSNQLNSPPPSESCRK